MSRACNIHCFLYNVKKINSRYEPHPDKITFSLIAFDVIAICYHNNFIEKYEEGMTPLWLYIQLSAQGNHIRDMVSFKQIYYLTMTSYCLVQM